jgi:hypothetical protein
MVGNSVAAAVARCRTELGDLIVATLLAVGTTSDLLDERMSCNRWPRVLLRRAPATVRPHRDGVGARNADMSGRNQVKLKSQVRWAGGSLNPVPHEEPAESGDVTRYEA